MTPFGPGEREMFHRVGDIHLGAVDPGGVQRPVQQPAGRADERLPGGVLPIARLFADQHHRRGARAGAEHRLGGVHIQVATLTGVYRFGQFAEVTGGGHEPGRSGDCHGGGLPTDRADHA